MKIEELFSQFAQGKLDSGEFDKAFNDLFGDLD